MNLELLVAQRLKYWSEQICEQVQHKWPIRQPAAITGNKEIHSNVVVTPGLVLSTIVASGGAAYQIEFGRGSGMTADNPYLQEYMHSDTWNDERMDATIRGRTAGTYTDLDGGTHESNGRMAGKNLESILWRGKKHDIRFAPTMPMFVIKDEIEFTWPLIVADIEGCVATAVSQEIVSTLTKDIYM